MVLTPITFESHMYSGQKRTANDFVLSALFEKRTLVLKMSITMESCASFENAFHVIRNVL